MDDANGSNETCGDEPRVWLAFPLTYLVLYAVGTLSSSAAYSSGLLLSWRGLTSRLQPPMRRLKQVSRKLASGDNALSRVLVFAMLLCNITYMALAFQRAYQPSSRCFSSLSEVPDLAVELVVSLPLIAFFFIRLLASDNLLLFWLQPHTLVDLVTLPNVYLALALGRDWRDTKSLRFIWLTQLTDLLRFLPFIHSQDTIDVISLLVRLVALWLSATGLVHILESTGDPWRDFGNPQPNTFLEYAYFTIVTMSTVGYGDYYAVTDIGKAFMTVFIIAGISFFAFALPALVELIVDYYHRTQWSRFDTTRVPQHVLVCGHITATTLADFLKDFLHKDRGDSKTHVLFMHTERPDPDLRKILRSYYTRVQYVVGSVLRSEDLVKAKLSDCNAVFILAEKHSDCPEREDRENLMRLVSVKNAVPDMHVVIQVLLSSSKAQVMNVSHTATDTVICLNELKLGLLGQDCLCPGLTTLISNLFYTSDASVATQGWHGLYSQGVSREVYLTPFSPAFEGMTFHEAAECCYKELGLILLAIEDKTSGQFYISPSPTNHPHLRVLTSEPLSQDLQMRGYFIGEDQNDVSRVSWYGQTPKKDFRSHMSTPLLSLQGSNSPEYLRKFSNTSLISQFSPTSTSLRAKVCDLHQTDFPQPLEACELQSGSPSLQNHVIVCIFADDTSSLLYLRNFLEPLRQRDIPRDQLRPVVFVSNRKFLEKEWPHINCFPELFVLPGCPLDWDTLTTACVESCHMCVILTASTQSVSQDPLMRDKEAILCSLMIHNHFKQTKNMVAAPVVITDLIEETNVQFLDIDDEDCDDGRIFDSQPFACGEAFAASLFDSITSSVFHSPGTLFLVGQIISASLSPFCSTRCHIRCHPLTQLPSSSSSSSFGQLYCTMLAQHKTCLAISRLISLPSVQPNSLLSTILPLTPHSIASSQRYIVSAPSFDTALHPSDHILVLEECLI